MKKCCLNTHIHTHKVKIKLATVVKGDPKLLHQGVGEGATLFPGLLHFTLDMYLIMLSVIKQGGIKYHFLNFWYDLTWEGTPVSRSIDKHSTLTTTRK